MPEQKDFKSMTKKEVVEYAKSLEEKAAEFDAVVDALAESQEQLELTQEEAAAMSETIRSKNITQQATAQAVSNLINGLNLALDNAKVLLETLGIISVGGQK